MEGGGLRSHALIPVVTEMWWAILSQPEGRSMPQRCGPMSSAALGRGHSRTACKRFSGRPYASWATGKGAAGTVRRHLPCRGPVEACLAAPLTSLPARCDRGQTILCGGGSELSLSPTSDSESERGTLPPPC